VVAYEEFTKAAIAAQQKPLAEAKAYPKAADFTRYSFDPVQAEYEAATRQLSLAKTEFRGTPPVSHVSVTAIEPDANPWPMVTLSDCRTGQDGWRAFDTRTGKPVAEQVPSSPASRSTVTVIYYHQRWGVNTIVSNPTPSCAD
jgi:hypothetical protein